MNRTVVNRGLRRAMAMVLAMVIYALPVAMPIAETTEVTAYAKSNKVLYSSAKKNISLKKGQKKTVTIAWKKKGKLSCKSSNIKVATCSISKKGRNRKLTIKAVGTGTVTVTVSGKGTKQKVRFKVTVKKPNVKLTTDSDTNVIIQKNSQIILQIHYTGTGELHANVADTTIAGTDWGEFYDNDISLTVSGKKAGKTTLTVTGDGTDTRLIYDITVQGDAITLSTTSSTTLTIKKNATQTAAITYKGDGKGTARCSSSDPSVATGTLGTFTGDNANLTITGKKAGSAVITVSADGATSALVFNVTVQAEPIELSTTSSTNITINKDASQTVSISYKGDVKGTARVQSADTTIATCSLGAFTGDNTALTITGKKAGKTTVTVTAAGTTTRIVFNVTVEDTAQTDDGTPVGKLSSYIEKYGSRNSDGNKFISYTDNQSDTSSTYGIVKYSDTSYGFVTSQQDYYSGGARTTVSFTSTLPATGNISLDMAFSSSSSAFMAKTSVNPSTYYFGKKLEFQMNDPYAGTSVGDADKEVAQSTVDLSFVGWEILLSNAGMSLKNLGFPQISSGSSSEEPAKPTDPINLSSDEDKNIAMQVGDSKSLKMNYKGTRKGNVYVQSSDTSVVDASVVTSSGDEVYVNLTAKSKGSASIAVSADGTSTKVYFSVNVKRKKGDTPTENIQELISYVNQNGTATKDGDKAIVLYDNSRNKSVDTDTLTVKNGKLVFKMVISNSDEADFVTMTLNLPGEDSASLEMTTMIHRLKAGFTYNTTITPSTYHYGDAVKLQDQIYKDLPGTEYEDETQKAVTRAMGRWDTWLDQQFDIKLADIGFTSFE